MVGQRHVTDLLTNAIEQGKIAHAYLLTGPRGTGKTSIARIIAHAVNGLPYSPDPHLDIIEIDAASNRRIDDIRDLRDKVHIAPVSAKYKVYIIDEVHMLTGESFNALLKTLEEPPEHAIFILATTEVHKVPATIISRTQRFHLHPARVDDIVSHLSGIAKKEKIKVDESALRLIAIHAAGSFRDSLSLLDQLSGLSEKITSELVEAVLGMASAARVASLVEAIIERHPERLLEELDAIEGEGVSTITLVEQLSRQLSIAAREDLSLYELLDSLVDIPKAYNPQLKLIARLVTFTKPRVSRTLATTHATIKPITATPTQLRAARTVSDKTLASLVVRPLQEKSPTHPASFDWSKVLTAIKKHHAPLFSVVTRAEATFDSNAQKLTLVLSYALHRKKLDSATSRKQLSSVIHDLFLLDPVIIIEGSAQNNELDDDAKAVADIMGGGEAVSGTI